MVLGSWGLGVLGFEILTEVCSSGFQSFRLLGAYCRVLRFLRVGLLQVPFAHDTCIRVAG